MLSVPQKVTLWTSLSNKSTKNYDVGLNGEVYSEYTPVEQKQHKKAPEWPMETTHQNAGQNIQQIRREKHKARFLNQRT